MSYQITRIPKMSLTTGLLVFSAFLAVSLCCTQERIDACQEPWFAYMDSIHANRSVSANGYAFSHLTDSELDGLCRIWSNSVRNCLKSLRPQCSLELRMEFEGTEDAVDFMCNTLPRYKPFKPCINSHAVAVGLNQCQNLFLTDLYNARLREDDQYIKQGICNAVQDAIACDYKAVKLYCGENAAQWVEEYQDLLNTPYMDEVHGCSGAGACTLQNEEKCWKQVNTFLEETQQSPIGYDEFDFRNLSLMHLSTFCTLYESSASRCLAELKPNCHVYEKQRFEGDEISLDFLCEAGLGTYAKHYTCLNKKELRQAETDCFAAFYSDLDKAYEKSTTTQVTAAYCKSISDFISCKQDTVSDQCGVEAGEWMSEFDRLWLQPYLDSSDCDNVMTSHCSEDRLNSCWEPVDTYLSTLDKDRKNLGLALRNLADSQVREFCSNYEDKVVSCLRDALQYCTRETKSLVNTEMYSLDYICGPNIDMNLKDRKCLMDNAVHTALQQCDVNFHAEETRAMAADKTEDEEILYCEAVAELLVCDTEALELHCSGETMLWSEQYLIYLHEPLNKDYCQDDKGLSGGEKAMIAIFTLLGIAILVAIAIIGYRLYQKRKAIKDQNAHVRFENPLSTDGARAPNPTATIQNGASNGYEVKTTPAESNDYSNAYATLEANMQSAKAKEAEVSAYAHTDMTPPTVEESDITATSNPTYDNAAKF